MSASRLLRVRTPGCAHHRSLAFAALLAAATVSVAGCAEDDGPTTHQVTIRNFQYTPATLDVARGDTVLWINQDVVPHTATADDQAWDTGAVGAKESGRVVVEQRGTYMYGCAFHPNMKAELSVR